jgi:hypothetical protein
VAKIADAFDIAAYELLEPEEVMPDDAVNINEQYTNDVYTAFGEILDRIKIGYVSNLTDI